MTPTMLKGCRMRFVMRGRLSRGGFIHQDQVVEHPRLTRTTGRVTSRDPVTVTWFVDDNAVADLAEACRRLAEAPIRRDLFA